MNRNLVMVFTRNPELGKVKTRLAKTIGDKSALIIYKQLLKHTEKTIKQVAADKAVYYSVDINENDLWDNTIYQKFMQSGSDLGERMKHAFINAFEAKYSKVIIVASDLYDITPNHIENAIQQLDKHDIVIGPSFDGGYYLLGMNRFYDSAFNKKQWGTETVLKDTLSDLKPLNVKLLESINDIDTYDDIKDISELSDLIAING